MFTNSEIKTVFNCLAISLLIIRIFHCPFFKLLKNINKTECWNNKPQKSPPTRYSPSKPSKKTWNGNEKRCFGQLNLLREYNLNRIVILPPMYIRKQLCFKGILYTRLLAGTWLIIINNVVKQFNKIFNSLIIMFSQVKCFITNPFPFLWYKRRMVWVFETSSASIHWPYVFSLE